MSSEAQKIALSGQRLILDSIEKRDALAAEEATRHHLENGLQVILKNISPE